MIKIQPHPGILEGIHERGSFQEGTKFPRAAIARISSRKLAGKAEIELTINNECARFLSNCIIFYNAALLSGLYEYYKQNKMEEECLKIIRLSPVAWQHINLIGIYEFYNNKEFYKSMLTEMFLFNTKKPLRRKIVTDNSLTSQE